MLSRQAIIFAKTARNGLTVENLPRLEESLTMDLSCMTGVIRDVEAAIELVIEAVKTNKQIDNGNLI